MIKAFNMETIFDHQWQWILDDPPIEAEPEAREEGREDEEAADLQEPVDDLLDSDEEDDSDEEVQGRPKFLACLAHTLQLVVNDAIKADKTSQDVSKYVDKLVEFFRRRGHWRTELKKLAKKELMKPIKTCWNSLLFAAERLAEVILGSIERANWS
jgi:hypothetical protein